MQLNLVIVMLCICICTGFERSVEIVILRFVAFVKYQLLFGHCYLNFHGPLNMKKKYFFRFN